MCAVFWATVYVKPVIATNKKKIDFFYHLLHQNWIIAISISVEHKHTLKIIAEQKQKHGEITCKNKQQKNASTDEIT